MYQVLRDPLFLARKGLEKSYVALKTGIELILWVL